MQHFYLSISLDSTFGKGGNIKRFDITFQYRFLKAKNKKYHLMSKFFKIFHF
jgi:hypothetical protein